MKARRLALSAALLFVTAAAGSAQAQLVYVSAYTSPDDLPGPKSASAGTVSIDHAVTDQYGDNGIVSATAAFGINKVAASSSSQTWLTSASAQSAWYDTITVTAARSGYLIAAIDIFADIKAAPGPSFSTASFLYEMAAGSAAQYIYSTTTVDNGFYSSGYLTETVDPAGNRRYATVAIPFIAGNAFAIRSIANCSTVGRANNNARQYCDASHSAYWGGILGVNDADGVAIADWSLTSASGTDYTKSFIPDYLPPLGVPEPATWAMLVTGFGMIGGGLRRRNRRQAMPLAA